MPDHEPNPDVTRSCVTLCCIKIKSGDFIDIRYDPSHSFAVSAADRYTVRGVFLGQRADGRIVIADVKSIQPITVLQRDRIIDVHIISSQEKDHASDD